MSPIIIIDKRKWPQNHDRENLLGSEKASVRNNAGSKKDVHGIYRISMLTGQKVGKIVPALLRKPLGCK